MNFKKLKSSLGGAPKKSGVYAICVKNIDTNKETVMYIGSSKNIYKRVYNNGHHYMILLKTKQLPEVVYIKFYVTKDYINIERNLIKKINPILNLTFKEV